MKLKAIFTCLIAIMLAAPTGDAYAQSRKSGSHSHTRKTTGNKKSSLSSGSSSGSSSLTAEVETFNVNGVTFEMVRVDGGSYEMDVDRDAHKETVRTFYIGKTEVTQKLWDAVMGVNPSHSTIDENLPIVDISWYDCQEFIKRLNNLTGKQFRLPTSAEWEYAARGGKKSKGYTYSGSNDVYDVAWYYENSGNKVHPVAKKLPNELGLYDMIGNVWEWCSDRSVYSEESKAIRGGSWCDEFGFGNCIGNSRYGRAPQYHHDCIGFRLAL